MKITPICDYASRLCNYNCSEKFKNKSFGFLFICDLANSPVLNSILPHLSNHDISTIVEIFVPIWVFLFIPTLFYFGYGGTIKPLIKNEPLESARIERRSELQLQRPNQSGAQNCRRRATKTEKASTSVGSKPTEERSFKNFLPYELDTLSSLYSNDKYGMFLNYFLNVSLKIIAMVTKKITNMDFVGWVLTYSPDLTDSGVGTLLLRSQMISSYVSFMLIQCFCVLNIFKYHTSEQCIHRMIHGFFVFIFIVTHVLFMKSEFNELLSGESGLEELFLLIGWKLFFAFLFFLIRFLNRRKFKCWLLSFVTILLESYLLELTTRTLLNGENGAPAWHPAQPGEIPTL